MIVDDKIDSNLEEKAEFVGDNFMINSEKKVEIVA